MLVFIDMSAPQEDNAAMLAVLSKHGLPLRKEVHRRQYEQSEIFSNISQLDGFRT